MAHRNARLTPYGRRLIVDRFKQGYPATEIAEMAGVSRATVYKTLRRFADEGEAGLVDHSSRPRLSPRKSSAEREEAIRALRCERNWGPHRIAYALGLARSTVYAVLRRLGLHRLDLLDRVTRQVIRITQTAPGELVHLDVKRLGRVPDGGGKRMDPGFARSGIGRTGQQRVGHDYLHVAIDGYSRYAYVEALPDERGDTTAGFLSRALEAFGALGVQVQALLTDNGGNYRSHPFREVADAAAVRLKRTRPYRPQTNGKAERFIKTLQWEWAYLRPYYSNPERLAALPIFLDEYNGHRPHTALGGLSPIMRICQ
ncbi:MAG: IS481 family transposase [Chloroflexota bacterium]|nr:IS481 family transposase [Chloroflexota bacterium]